MEWHSWFPFLEPEPEVFSWSPFWVPGYHGLRNGDTEGKKKWSSYHQFGTQLNWIKIMILPFHEILIQEDESIYTPPPGTSWKFTDLNKRTNNSPQNNGPLLKMKGHSTGCLYNCFSSRLTSKTLTSLSTNSKLLIRHKLCPILIML